MKVKPEIESIWCVEKVQEFETVGLDPDNNKITFAKGDEIRIVSKIDSVNLNTKMLVLIRNWVSPFSGYAVLTLKQKYA